jgi:hypothetical protein
MSFPSRDPRFDVCFTLRVSYDDRDKAKELKCRWCPDTKKWKKSFTNKGFYRDVDILDYYHNVQHFIKRCGQEHILIEDDEGLEELEDYMIEDEYVEPKPLPELPLPELPLPELPLCKVCKVEPVSAGCFLDCKNCYNKAKYDVKRCNDCKKPITYGDYVRCFDCNRTKWIKEQNAYEHNTRECLIVDD